MPSTVYKGDISEATFGHETGFTLEYDYHNGLRFSVQATAGDITTLRMTAGGGSGHFVGANQYLCYPVGLLAGSKLRIKGGGALSADDHATTGNIYTIVDNYGTDILVTPALKESVSTDSAAGDALIIDSLGTPTPDVGMVYSPGAAASDETVLTDQFIGLAATLTFPETKAEIRRSHVIGIGRDVVVQEPQRFSNEGGSIEMMLNSPRWLYYGLGNEAVYGGLTAKATLGGPAAAAVSMGDTFVEFVSGTVTNPPTVGEYILIVDTTDVLTPTDHEDPITTGTKWTQLQTNFQTTERNELRRVICIDTTGSVTRIHVDDPFNFNHDAGCTIKTVAFHDGSTNGSPHFDTATATYGTITNRQSRALFSGYHTPSFSLETSMRTRDVDSYGTGGYTGSQASNVPNTASDSKQLTRIYKGCKVKEWSIAADADAEVKMTMGFDALMCYTDTGRLEDSVGGVATLTVTEDGSGYSAVSAAASTHHRGSGATFTTTILNGVPETLGPMTNVGTGYTAGVKATTSAGSGTGLTVDITVNGGFVTSATIVAHGSGYAASEVITVSTGGANATFTVATISNGVLNTVAVNAAGSGYRVGDVLTLAGGSGGTVTVATVTAAVGDRYTAHRMFENVGNGLSERKAAGIAPNTEKPYFFYNGTISAFGMNIAQVTNFSLSGRNNTTTHYTIRGNPQAEARNTSGQSLEQIPFGGARNPSLIVEGKVEYEMAMTIIVSDPLLWHEFRTNRTHNHTEPITLTLTKAGAGANREQLVIIVDDYIIAEAPLGIPEDKGVIKSELKIMPKHVKVVSHDALLHC